MNDFLRSLLAIALLIAAASCTQNPTENDEDDPANVSQQLFPLTNGSAWEYAGLDNFTLKVIGTKTILGREYAEVARTSPNDTDFVRQEGNAYYVLTSDFDEDIVVIDGEPGTTWNALRDHGDDFFTEDIYTIEEVGASRTIGAETFEGVVRVKWEARHKYESLGTWETDGVYDIYWARGVGYIERTERGGDEARTVLISYSIK